MLPEFSYCRVGRLVSVTDVRNGVTCFVLMDSKLVWYVSEGKCPETVFDKIKVRVRNAACARVHELNREDERRRRLEMICDGTKI